MQAKRLSNGNLLVPKRAEGDGHVGDAMVEIEKGSEEYERWDRYLKSRGR